MKKHNSQRGLSFIELIVVVAIMGLISTIVLFRQAKFSSDILITNMAYQIALSIRQAEVYGLSSKKVDTGSLITNFRSGYGVLFTPVLSRGIESDDNASAFAFFADTPINSSIDAGEDAVFNYVYNPGSDVLLEPYPIRLTQGQRIRGYCGRVTSTADWRCWSYADAALDSSHKVLSVTFVKPNPEAHITMGTASTCGEESYGCESFLYDNDAYDSAKIIVESTLGDKCRTISVANSGEISVDPVDLAAPNGGCDIQF